MLSDLRPEDPGSSHSRRRLVIGVSAVVSLALCAAVAVTIYASSGSSAASGLGRDHGGTGSQPRSSSASFVPSLPVSGTALSSSTTTLELPPPGDGALPQTTVEPTTDTEAFRGEMTVLWQAIKTGRPQTAMPAFFPESAYLQVKALSNDAADYTQRLLAHFNLDILAAHAALGPNAASAHLVSALVPSYQAAWISPGACYNKLGYWHVPGSRMVYEIDGEQRSFGIASLISWRGYWYVVHLGSVLPPAGQGVVFDPSPGTGSYGPPGGC